MSFDPGTDICLKLWAEASETLGIMFPPNATILEIGCAEADWMTPMLKERPDVKITGIDWRPCERPGLVYQEDVRVVDFPSGSFDAVVGISSIEHIGLGHYADDDGQPDPRDTNGDINTMHGVVTWLKPGGLFYADVPYNAHGYRVCGTSHREYDEAAIRERLIVPGLTMKAMALHIPPNGGMSYAMVLAEKVHV